MSNKDEEAFLKSIMGASPIKKNNKNKKPEPKIIISSHKIKSKNFLNIKQSNEKIQSK